MGYWLRVSNISLDPPRVKSDFNSEFMLWYQSLITHASEYINEWENHFKAKNSCCIECNKCCYQMIDIYSYELLPILAYIKINNLQSLLVKAEPIAELLEKNMIDLSFLSDEYADESKSIKSKMKYRLLSIPCIFLVDNKCSIYPVRPSCCATYYSYGNVKDCYNDQKLPKDCYSHKDIEDWIFGQITDFMHYNIDKLPESFKPFKANILPLAIKDYLEQNK